jgi:hypothetical protein
MMVLRCIIFVCASLCCFSAALADGNCTIAEQAIAQASVIRKLPIKTKVPCYVHTKEQVTEFVRESVKEKIPPSKLRNEERLFKLLGLIPESFSYETGLIDLYVNQIGGYYDPERNHFIMAGWLPEIMQPTIAAHELTHALQDQYYDLGKFIDPKTDNSDDQLARSALVEGDATAVMMDYIRGLTGQKGLEHDPNVDAILMQNVVGASLTAGTGLPEGLQLLLIFPYTSGLRFAHDLLKEGSYQAIDAAFKKPPSSTEEILHPEIYRASIKSYRTFSLDDGAQHIPAPHKIIYSDTIGEFGVSTLLSLFIADKSRAAQAAKGWGGDRAFYAEKPSSGKETAVGLLVWKTAWDSEQDSQEFYQAAQDMLVARFKLPLQGCSGKEAQCLVTSAYRVTIAKKGVEVQIVVEPVA